VDISSSVLCVTLPTRYKTRQAAKRDRFSIVLANRAAVFMNEREWRILTLPLLEIRAVQINCSPAPEDFSASGDLIWPTKRVGAPYRKIVPANTAAAVKLAGRGIPMIGGKDSRPPEIFRFRFVLVTCPALSRRVIN